MSADQAMITYRHLIGALRGLAESGATGSVYFVTNDNHSAVFGFEHGEIVSIRCRRFKGMDALDALLSIRSGRYRFVPHSSGLHRLGAPLPPTSELLTILETQNDIESPATPVQSPPQSPPEISDAQIADMREIIATEATEHLGPMASFICDEFFDAVKPTNSSGILQVVERVATDIGDPEREQTFKDQVVKRLAIVP